MKVELRCCLSCVCWLSQLWCLRSRKVGEALPLCEMSAAQKLSETVVTAVSLQRHLLRQVTILLILRALQGR